MKIFFLAIVTYLSISAFQSSQIENHDLLIFSGVVLEKGPTVGPSGNIAQYQEVTYGVENVCEGNYSKDKIVTEHLILDPYELKNLQVGDKVCVGAAKKIIPNYLFDNTKKEFILSGDKFVYRVNDILIKRCRCTQNE